MRFKDNNNFYYKSADEVEQAFYQAFGEGNMPLMQSILAKREVSFSHSNSSLISGFENAINHWNLILDGIQQTQVNYEVLSVTKSQDIEVHLVLESIVIDQFIGKITDVMSTNVYVFEENSWRLQSQQSSSPEIRHCDFEEQIPFAKSSYILPSSRLLM